MKTTCRNRRRLRPFPVLSRSAALLALGFLVAGCPSQPQPPAVTEGKIVIKGSNTIGEELAPRLIAEYHKDHPGVNITLASRVATQEELLKAQAAGIDFNVHTVGHYSVAVILNRHNPVANLSREQVRDIFTGTIENWKAVGGPDAPIHRYVRDQSSGTYLGFRELAMEDKPYAADVKALTNYVQIADAVGKDPDGIGYASLNLADRDGVKSISIRGTPASSVSVNEGRY